MSAPDVRVLNHTRGAEWMVHFGNRCLQSAFKVLGGESERAMEFILSSE